MLRRTSAEKAIFNSVLITQMIKRNLFTRDEVAEQEEVVRVIERDFPEIRAAIDKKTSVSHGLVRRRNLEYKKVVDALLGPAAAKRFERMIYEGILYEDMDTENLTDNLVQLLAEDKA